MFESQLQTTQLTYGICVLSTVGAILTLVFGLPGIVLLLLLIAAVTGAIGGWLLADLRGYHPAIGLGLGLGLGAMSAVILVILPDRTVQQELEAIRRHREKKRRSQNYEVLDDDDD